MSEPVAPVTPVTPVVPVTPDPIPITPPPVVRAGTKWFESAAFLTWLITTAVSIVGGVAVIIGHPFNSAVVTSAGTAAAWAVAGVTTAVFVHGQQKLALQKASFEHENLMFAQGYYDNGTKVLHG